MNFRIFSLLISFLLPLLASAQVPRGWTTIVNGSPWTDTEGNVVQAHAPGFLFENGRWYMVGEDRSDRRHPDVNLYSSADLQHWRFEHKIIRNGVTSPELGTTRMIERPKLLRNARTGKYVVWCHWEASDYGASEAACFSCDSLTGNYRLEWSGRPCGVKSRDCNVFLDDDGTAWFISTTSENTNLGLFRLSDDYLRAVDHTVLLPGKRREAPAIVRIGSDYWMFSSACTGWAPNQCKFTRSTSLTDGWLPLVSVGDDKAFRTQAAAVLTIRGTKRTTYLYVGDRWLANDLPNSPTIIFPISFENGFPRFHYLERFEINFRTGEWRPAKM